MTLELERPVGDVENTLQSDTSLRVPGTSGFGITSGGQPYHQLAAQVPAHEKAVLVLTGEGAPYLILESAL